MLSNSSKVAQPMPPASTTVVVPASSAVSSGNEVTLRIRKRARANRSGRESRKAFHIQELAGLASGISPDGGDLAGWRHPGRRRRVSRVDDVTVFQHQIIRLREERNRAG